LIVPDVNLLVYAYNSDSPDHLRAAEWWQTCLSGESSVGLPLAVILGFVRVTTNPRVFERPFTPKEAADHVRSWLAQPRVSVLPVSEAHLEAVLTALEEIGTAGNLVTDAQIAALAIEHDAVLHTADGDFIRFHGLRWKNPLRADRKPRKG
jgi:toxin-antitoxin system PIN domain toxin